uniref:Uncharacterized protein n=1 Tax=Anguilla anguilla TaxID=7936 RepID=A0A0E9XTZ4_ANGAN
MNFCGSCEITVQVMARIRKSREKVAFMIAPAESVRSLVGSGCPSG